jgi:hypothetical protein
LAGGRRREAIVVQTGQTVVGGPRGRKPPLPRATVILRCEECKATIDEMDANTTSLAGAVARARRAHAIEKHNYRE